MSTNQAYEYSPDIQLASFRIRQGAILWLPGFKEVKKHCHERRKSNTTWASSRLFSPVRIRAPQNAPPFTLTMYGHPILVVSGPQNGSHEIDFLLMTTLGSNWARKMITIAEHAKQAKFSPAKQRLEIAKHLPVEPSPRHPVSGILLKHKYGMIPDKFGNVAFHGVYSMDWRDAQLYWDGKKELKDRIWELNDLSMAQVLQVARRECQYTPPVQAAMTRAEELMVWRYAHPQQARMYDQWQRFLRTFGPTTKAILWYLMWPVLVAAVVAGLLPAVYCILLVMEHFLKFYTEEVRVAKDFVRWYMEWELSFLR